MINPSIFIGLGSSGKDILEHIDEIFKIITQKINTTKNLCEVRQFLFFLDREIEKTIASLPVRYPIISPLFLDEILQKEKPTIFDLLKKGFEKKKKSLTKIYEYILSLLMEIRAFRVKPILINIREILGGSISNPQIPSKKEGGFILML